MYSFERNKGVAVANIRTLGDNSIIGFISKSLIKINRRLEENPEGFFKPLPEKLLILTFNDLRSSSCSVFEIDYIKENYNVEVIDKCVEDGEHMTFIDDVVEWK